MTVETTYNPFTVAHCLHCGDPIQQPRHGGRPRRYCDKPACRKAGSRLTRKLEEERADAQQREYLRLLWQRLYDPTASSVLEEILTTSGTNVATLATEALNRERTAMHKLIEAQRIVAEAQSKAEGNQDALDRLRLVQELEIRFRLDTQARHLKAWLKRQGTYLEHSLPRRLIADERLPFYGSRALYEAKLRVYGYSDEDIYQFQELWKALLLAEGK